MQTHSEQAYHNIIIQQELHNEKHTYLQNNRRRIEVQSLQLRYKLHCNSIKRNTYSPKPQIVK